MNDTHYLPYNEDYKHDTDVYTAPRIAPRSWGGYVGAEFRDVQNAHTQRREQHRTQYEESIANAQATTAAKGGVAK